MSAPEIQIAAWSCKVRAAGATDPPQDCDWPHCGCDPHAEKVIAALQEEGWQSERELIAHVADHWFTQGGKAQFGALGQPTNPDELVSTILELVREKLTAELDNHHNALACPYCNPDKDLVRLPSLRRIVDIIDRNLNYRPGQRPLGWSELVALLPPRESADGAGSR